MSSAAPFDLAETDRLLSTTRSVRRRLDLETPVPRELIEEALRIAVQAPTADNAQNWRWLVITEPETKEAIAQLFRRAWKFHKAEISTKSGRRRNSPQARKNEESAAALPEAIAKVPALILPCVVGKSPDAATIDAEWERLNAHKPADDPAHQVRMGQLRASTFYGSIFPAIWSLQLALRSRGLGSTITCMHLPFARQAAELLGIPSGVTQICMVPVAYTIGTSFRPAQRIDAGQRTFWEGWGK